MAVCVSGPEYLYPGSRCAEPLEYMRVNGKSVCLAVRKSRLEKTRMSFSDAEGSARSAIPGRPSAGVDGGEEKRATGSSTTFH